MKTLMYLILCCWAVAVVFFSRLEDSTPGRRKTKRFHRFTRLFCVLAIIPVIIPAISEFKNYRNNLETSESIVRCIVENLEESLDKAGLWKVLLKKKYAGKPKFLVRLSDENIIRYINDDNLAEKVRKVYGQIEQVDSDLNNFRVLNGYGSDENVRRMQVALDGLVASIQDVLLDFKNNNINISEEAFKVYTLDELEAKHKDVLRSGVATSDSLTFNAGQDYYVPQQNSISVNIEESAE